MLTHSNQTSHYYNPHLTHKTIRSPISNLFLKAHFISMMCYNHPLSFLYH